MKKIYCYALLIAFVFFQSNISAQNANKNLSNLTAPTAVNVNLLPKNNDVQNLGSATKAWHTLYLNSSLFIDGQKFIFTPGTRNTFTGSNAGKLWVTGTDNTADGFQSLYNNAKGSVNTATGSYSLFSNTNGSYNTAYGAYSLYSNHTGEFNTANGRAALYHNNGHYNTAMGDEALYENGAGSANTAIGATALGYNTTGRNNTATGISALLSNTIGNDNVAIGSGALYHNTVGSYFLAIGDSALYYQNGGAGYNTAVGFASMYTNTTGAYNTALGYAALAGNTTGSGNTAAGVSALRFSNGDRNSAFGTNTLAYNTGSDNTAVGNNALNFNAASNSNTGIGSGALGSTTTGGGNTATGSAALGSNVAGTYNTANGMFSLSHSNESYNTACGAWTLANTYSSRYNTAIGCYAGYSHNFGYNNVFVGANADALHDNDYNMVAIGEASLCSASNQARIGNSFTSSIGGWANWTTFSDIRVKKNIKHDVPGLAFINKLQPITYNLDIDAADRIFQRAALKDADGKLMQPAQQDLNAKNAKEQIIYTGFSAQDVEKAARSLNYDFSGVDAAKNDKDLYGLRYAEFVVPLVKAVQELSAKNDSLQNQNIFQQKQIDRQLKINSDLQDQINELKAMITSSNQSITFKTINLSSASLEQNVPNPFNTTTTIRYTLPQQYSSAKIIITDKSGHVLKEMNVSGVGKGSVQIDAPTLATGAYQYSLVVDGKLIDTKQMVLTK